MNYEKKVKFNDTKQQPKNKYILPIKKVRIC